MTTAYYFHKAQTGGDRPIESVEIHISQPLQTAETYTAGMENFKHEGSKLAQVLYNVLPGGTFDQTLRAMLELKASCFVVPFGGDPESPTPDGSPVSGG